MPNQSKPKEGSIPDLSGLISKEDLHKKGSFATYMNWARTTQYLRENAPGWEFHLEPRVVPTFDLGEQKTLRSPAEPVWEAPNGTGYLMCFFQNGEKKTPLFPFPIMDNRNNPLPLNKISARDVSDSHRRGLCACAAFVFGLAYELWARIEIEEAERVDAAPIKKEIARSPQRGANARQVKASPVAHEMVTGKVTQASIPQAQKDALAKELQTLPHHGRNRVVSAFRQEYKISSEKISEFITTPEHLSFIRSKIAEVESDSP
jgi:hypothetical protein